MKKKSRYILGILLGVCVLVGGIKIAERSTSRVLHITRAKDYPADEWTITQYGPRDINSMFYTIYNPQNGLIVIDGGWTEDGPFVRETVEALGGKADAWILTHPHLDHISAFASLYPDLRGIEIGDIYTVDMASPEKCQKRAKWDSVDAYREFLALEVEDLKYVYPGDVLNICGLEVDIFNAYDEHVEELSKDYLNDGSMMFKIKGETQSVLFCADVGKRMSDYLLETWGDDLKADYIQMGHHGNGGLLADFYTKVSPEVAFFDAPDWLMYDTTGNYTTPENSELMESLGSEVVSFHTQPNSVILR
ncbi:MAG: MBL fold metallo-hydrolase [Lachnospiraceae bacterium]|nr:MBL fold metallo-hydrolase [Lachnospiraceae bacterium]